MRDETNDGTESIEDYQPPKILCSFCALDRFQVRLMIRGRGQVYICDQCVDLCVDVLAGTAVKKVDVEPVKEEIENGNQNQSE